MFHAITCDAHRQAAGHGASVAARASSRAFAGQNEGVLESGASPGNQALLRIAGSAHGGPSATGVLQRKCACGESAGGSGPCEECAAKEAGSLQRRANDGATSETVPPIVQQTLNEPGQPLDASTRTFMEPHFGQDFSAVRIHTGAAAAASARAVNALA